jgi:hypothetical protein
MTTKKLPNYFFLVVFFPQYRGHASNLQEALNIWSTTNNTLGMNHQIGSAADNFPGKV